MRLAFSDGSAITLPPDDPRARVFRALADEIARGVTPEAPRPSRRGPRPPMPSW